MKRNYYNIYKDGELIHKGVTSGEVTKLTGINNVYLYATRGYTKNGLTMEISHQVETKTKEGETKTDELLDVWDDETKSYAYKGIKRGELLKILEISSYKLSQYMSKNYYVNDRYLVSRANNMKILVACEESQAVTIELRKLGHEAYSCDIEPCSGGHPEWHLQQDVVPLLKEKWDMIIAFPPCTYLTVAGNRWFNVEKYGAKAIQRVKNREEAINFFMMIANADCERIAIENPVGIMSTQWRKPDQIIQPYMFGDKARKGTCLWLKGLPLLQPTNIVDTGKILEGGYSVGASAHYARDENGKIIPWNDPRTAKIRSKTFPGIAKAMAEQWAGKCQY